MLNAGLHGSQKEPFWKETQLSSVEPLGLLLDGAINSFHLANLIFVCRFLQNLT